MNNDETFELCNVDPEDVAEVLMKAEASFGFQFGDEELKKVRTFGELCDVIAGKVVGEESNDCTSQQAFYKLRHAVATATQMKCENVKLDADVRQLFPKPGRRKSIKEMERQLGFNLDLLSPQSWVLTALFIILLASIVFLFVDWQVGLGGVLFFAAGLSLAVKLGKEMDLQTIRELTQRITREHYRKARRNPSTINKNEVTEQVKALFIADLGLDKSNLHREATFN